MGKITYVLYILVLCLAQNAGARSGQHQEGGNLIRASKAKKISEIKMLKNKVLESIGYGLEPHFKNSDSYNLYVYLKNNGLVKDIQNSKYVFKQECIPEGTDYLASTIKQKGADICFSTEKLINENASISEMIGLALHEHAHHFGYSDNELTDRFIIDVAHASEKSLNQKDVNLCNSYGPEVNLAANLFRSCLDGNNFLNTYIQNYGFNIKDLAKNKFLRCVSVKYQLDKKDPELTTTQLYRSVYQRKNYCDTIKYLTQAIEYKLR